MQLVDVRVHRTGPNDGLLITYPEGHLGHDLICCLSCGGVHAVCVARVLYSDGDLTEHVESASCHYCNARLVHNWANYPETWVDEKGHQRTFQRDPIIPQDEYSSVVKLPEVTIVMPDTA